MSTPWLSKMALMEEMRGGHKLIKCSILGKQKEKNKALWIEGEGIR
jgi:hypothetical protein